MLLTVDTLEQRRQAELLLPEINLQSNISESLEIYNQISDYVGLVIVEKISIGDLFDAVADMGEGLVDIYGNYLESKINPDDS